MKSFIYAVALALPLTGAATEYRLDPSHTYPHFSIRHLGVSTTIGRFNETSGTLVMDRENDVGSLNVVVKTASVDSGHAARDEHVRKEDFLFVEQYPEMTYQSTKVTFHGPEKDTATVEGTLTLRGVTQPLTLTVTRIVCGEHAFTKKPFCGFDATGQIKRSDFGMTYAPPPIVGDEVDLLLSTEAFPVEAAK